MEEYFLLKEFENGYDIHELRYEEEAWLYCTNTLEIPNEKIDSISVTNDGMEIILTNLDNEDIKDDWFISLYRSSVKEK